MTVHDKDPLDGGLSVPVWFELFWMCHTSGGMGGLVRTTFPDGGAPIEQPVLVVEMFALLTNAVTEEAERHSGGSK